jgi:hypothetical protein
MLSLPFVIVLVAIVLVLRRTGYFAARRSQQIWYAGAFVGIGIFGAYLIQALGAGLSPPRAILGASVLSVVGTGIILVLVRLRSNVGP